MNSIFPLLSFIFLIFHFNDNVDAQMGDYKLVKLNDTAEIPLPVSANYRRSVRNAKYETEEHLYRVCNGKNKKTCGFWENVKTKKKVPSGPTTYNKNKKLLIVKRIRETDFGDYMTGNRKKTINVMKLNVKG